MFNWFRRKFNDTPQSEENQEKSSNQESQESQKTSSNNIDTTTTNQTTDNEEYLNWAKAAYQNISQQKQQQSTPVEEEKDDVNQTDSKEANLPETQQVKPDEQKSAPAWLQKSNRLAELKETAIEKKQDLSKKDTKENQEKIEKLDEDFVWSAKVLANEGRKPEEVAEEEFTWLQKLRKGLGKTRRGLVNQLKAVVGAGPLSKDVLMEIEAILLQADVGIEATDYIIETLEQKIQETTEEPKNTIDELKTILTSILDKPLEKEENKALIPDEEILNIWMLTGINGAGKTTTIGKLAHMAKTSGYNCLIAAADTFRAAAVEQVKVWGERCQVEVIANNDQNTDPAAVVFDAINAANSRQSNLLLVDTAGRLQNKKNLMAELAKIRRIIDKKAPHAKVESILVLDATLGQNGITQASVFAEAASLSGVILTKLDSSAKGGVAIAVAQQLNLPIRFIGAGEGIEDLRPFSSYEFVEALLNG